MIKLNPIGKKAIYYSSPYESNISLSQPFVKSVKWSKDGKQGVMVVSKNTNLTKIALFPQLYTGKGSLEKMTKHANHHIIRRVNANLTKVGTSNFNLGFMYNLRQLYL